jgi:hypothetical protein
VILGTQVSIPLRADAAIFNQGQNTAEIFRPAEILDAPIPYDEVALSPRFNLSSSSGIVTESWVPANEGSFRDRVFELTKGPQLALAGWENTPLSAAASGFFKEFRKLYVDGSRSFNLVPTDQSHRLPERLKRYGAP